MSEISAQTLLKAYSIGVFPMSESRDNPDLFWVDPDQRGIFEIDRFHISKSLAREIKKQRYQVSFDQEFTDVVRHCAERDETWINDTLFSLYRELHDWGFAHSIEIKDQDMLVGGVFGITIGGAFFGESMFSTRTNASKIALAYLMKHLSACGFQLFDTQFITPHLASLGAIEIPRRAYKSKLSKALIVDADFHRVNSIPTPYSVIQRITHTS